MAADGDAKGALVSTEEDEEDFRTLPGPVSRNREKKVATNVALNLSILVGFKSDYRTPVAHGYVQKYTSNGGTFQRRYLVQRGSILLNYESHRSHDPRGAFILDGCTVQRHARLIPTEGLAAVFAGSATHTTPYSLVLRRPTPSVLAWELNLPTEGDLDAWIAAFVETGVVKRLPDVERTAPAVSAAPTEKRDDSHDEDEHETGIPGTHWDGKPHEAYTTSK